MGDDERDAGIGMRKEEGWGWRGVQYFRLAMMHEIVGDEGGKARGWAGGGGLARGGGGHTSGWR